MLRLKRACMSRPCGTRRTFHAHKPPRRGGTQSESGLRIIHSYPHNAIANRRGRGRGVWSSLHPGKQPRRGLLPPNWAASSASALTHHPSSMGARVWRREDAATGPTATGPHTPSQPPPAPTAPHEHATSQSMGPAAAPHGGGSAPSSSRRIPLTEAARSHTSPRQPFQPKPGSAASHPGAAPPAQGSGPAGRPPTGLLRKRAHGSASGAPDGQPHRKRFAHTSADAQPSARLAHAAGSSEPAAQDAHWTPTPHTGQTPAAAARGSSSRPAPLTKPPADVEAELRSKIAAMEELRRKLKETEAAVARAKEFKAEREAAQRQQQEESMRKKAQLSRGFKSLAAAVQPSGAAPAGQGPGTGREEDGRTRVPVQAADEWEVARVLHSQSDHECLKLHVGASMAQVRRSYRQMAMALHPDKCKLDGAAQAFQRLKRAYDNLTAIGP